MASGQTRHTPRGGLVRRYALLITALVTLLLAATGVLTLHDTYRENLDHLRALQAQQAQGAAARIEEYLAAIERELGWPALAGMNAGGDPLEVRRIELLKLLRQVPAITEAAWLDDHGLEQLRVSRIRMEETGEGVDRSAEPLFTEAAAGRVWRSPVSFRKQTEPYLTIAQRAGLGGGVVLAEVNLKFVWDVVGQIRPGRGGVAYVIDRNGALIAHPDISLVLRQTGFATLPQVEAAFRSAEGPGVGGDDARDLNGQPVLSAWAPLQPLGWHVFVESPRAQALAPVWQNLRRLALVLAAGLLVAAVASTTLARQLVLPIRALSKGAERIAAGDLEHRITAAGGDELQVLAEDFNHMADALKTSYQELEQRVEQRTAELSQALAHQTATAEVLQVISSSVADEQPVYEKILDSVCRLFGSGETAIFRAPGDGLLHLAATTGDVAGRVAALYPRPLAETSGARVIEQRQQVCYPHVLDPAADMPPSLRSAGEVLGDFSIVLTPMLRGGEGIGVLAVRRAPGAAFTDKELALLRTFADQAVIAIENARLLHELETQSRELEIASRHKSEFLAHMSHELRTPLNAVIGFSEVLIEKMFGDVNDKQLEYLHDIHSSGQHLLQLINDILDLTKIEAGRMELDATRVDLPELLDHALTLVRERAQRQGLRLKLDVAGDIGDAVVDQRKLMQTLLNLLSNAVKFTPGGGEVRLSARRIAAEDGADGADALEIAVSDTGVGIAPAEHEAVFEAFRQASGNYLRKSEGTGLGLALVKSFVALHGGTVRLDSAPGQGATFTITLPQQAPELV